MPTKKHLDAPTWTQLRRVLLSLEKPELIDMIQQLYQLNADNKVFLVSRLTNVDVETLAAPYRAAIRHELNPERGLPKLNLRAARKAVNDFKKACDDPAAVADLMLFYVEQGVICTNEYGDMYESFYNSLESVYAEAARVITNSGRPDLIDQYRPRMQRIVTNTRNIGWGFHDTLADIFFEYMGED
jgi:hypothetical protein